MKKFLFGTTALVAASAMAAGTASAENEKLQIGVGGYFQSAFLVADYDDDSGRRGHSLEREAEIIFNGETTFDNGLSFGVQVQLEAETCGDQIDESFMYVEGSFGRVNIGSENSAPYLMNYASPAPSYWAFGVNSPNFSATGRFPSTNAVSTSGDSEKITYFTPRFAGFQLGLSYTPDVCEEAGCGGTYSGTEADDGTDGTPGEAIEVGANYVQTFDMVNLALSAGYGTRDEEAAGLEDQTEWNVGGQVGFAGFTFGAAYRKVRDLAGADGIDQTNWNAGVRYSTGPWGVGIQYANHDTDGGSEYDAWEIGGSYDVGPGVVLFGGFQRWDDDTTDEQDNIFFVGTHVGF